jgi:AcrR family transcriptional regulator
MRSASESKKRIIKAALDIFSRYGYARASMRMIAKSAHISTGGLYLYFRNKEDLYMSLVKDRLEDFSAIMQRSVQGAENPENALRAFITVNLDYARKHRELILVEGKEHGFSSSVNFKKQFYKKQTRLIESIIRKGITTGVFRRCNVKEAAKIIKCAIRGFVLSMIIEEQALFTAKHGSELILQGILRRSNS